MNFLYRIPVSLLYSGLQKHNPCLGCGFTLANTHAKLALALSGGIDLFLY